MGTLLILLTPATFHRIGAANDIKEPMKIVSFLASLLECYKPYMEILFLIVLFRINRKHHKLKDYCMENMLILFLVFSFLMFLALSVVSVMPAQRFFYFFHVMALFLIVKELSLIKEIKNRVFVVSALLVSFVVGGGIDKCFA